jgi:glycosyltransferase involved in cell wall biosynthesis
MSSDTAGWPRISVVTPSFNQAAFVESTLRSVLDQGYPNLEYIVIDGGSTDGSVEIIQHYADRLAYWISEPDRGQSHAINKGFKRASGELFAWLNSDDEYLPGALEVAARAARAAPGALVAASVVTVDERPGRGVPDHITRHANLSFERLVKLGRHPLAYHQPGLFFPSDAWRQVNGLDERLLYAMDYDLLCRLLQTCRVTYVRDIVARFRLHGESKTCSQWLAMVGEQVGVASRYQTQAGMTDERALDEYVVEGLVNLSATQALRGCFGDAADMLGRALRKDPGMATHAIVGQVSSGIRRQALRRLAAARVRAATR